jgi:hypothetical protein
MTKKASMQYNITDPIVVYDRTYDSDNEKDNNNDKK